LKHSPLGCPTTHHPRNLRARLLTRERELHQPPPRAHRDRRDRRHHPLHRRRCL